MKAKAVVRLELPSEKHSETVFVALKPEVSKPTNRRSNATVEKEGVLLTLKVEANDAVALRAALNAYLRWMSSIMRVLEILKTR